MNRPIAHLTIFFLLSLTQLALAGTLPGDADNNGCVNIDDLNGARNNLGKSVPTGTSADFDFDGQITNLDVKAVQSNFGKCATAGLGKKIADKMVALEKKFPKGNFADSSLLTLLDELLYRVKRETGARAPRFTFKQGMRDFLSGKFMPTGSPLEYVESFVINKMVASKGKIEVAHSMKSTFFGGPITISHIGANLTSDENATDRADTIFSAGVVDIGHSYNSNVFGSGKVLVAHGGFNSIVIGVGDVEVSHDGDPHDLDLEQGGIVISLTGKVRIAFPNGTFYIGAAGNEISFPQKGKPLSPGVLN